MHLRSQSQLQLQSRAIRWTLLLSLLVSVSASAESFSDTWRNLWLRKDQQAQSLLQSGKPAEAAPLYSDPRHRAYAELKAQQFADAAKRLAPLKDAQSEYNRGNALAHTGDLKNALAAYDAALKQTPNDKDAQHNRDLVARALQEQQQKSSQNKSGKDQSGKDQSGHKGNSEKNESQQSDSGQNKPGDEKSDKNNSSDEKSKEQNAKDGQQQQAQSKPSPAEQAKRSEAEKQASAQQQEKDNADAARDAAAALAQAKQQPSAKPASDSEQDKKNADMHARVDATDSKPQTEQALAMDQWLRRIPDDPAGLLRRKFLIEHMLKQREAQQ